MKPRSLLCLALATIAFADDLHAEKRGDRGTPPRAVQMSPATVPDNAATNGLKQKKLRFVDEDGDGINDMVQGLPSIDEQGRSGNEMRGTGPAYRLFFDGSEPRLGEHGAGKTKNRGKK